ncbi:hypothetical protein [Globicatella sulfidifaciens]|uniref:Uncharacterized protein n=1 Tax=Globicatella sulfidifaciens TaxID=136093 RepID=A0A7X8H094_9LACT|nr:hypothetical protein [Globicatella sulfidifaciens]NLJ18372.1 hypothetical protein [Globicatella sulfidifaciens]
MFEISCDNTITLTKGNTCAFCVEPIIADTEEPYILQGDDKIIFTVKKRFFNELVMQKVLTNSDYDESSNLVIQLDYNDTADLDATTYAYDIALQTESGDFYTFISKSAFRIVKNVTERLE